MTPSRDEVRAIAREAYVHGFAVVDDDRVHYACFVDESTFTASSARAGR